MIFEKSRRFRCLSVLAVLFLAAGCRPEAKNETASAPLKSGLQDSNPDVRAGTLQSMSSLQICPPEELPDVIRLLGDDLRIIRWLAADCLNYVGAEAKSELDAIKAAHDKETDVEIRGKLRDAMTRIRLIP